MLHSFIPLDVGVTLFGITQIYTTYVSFGPSRRLRWLLIIHFLYNLRKGSFDGATAEIAWKIPRSDFKILISSYSWLNTLSLSNLSSSLRIPLAHEISQLDL